MVGAVHVHTRSTMDGTSSAEAAEAQQLYSLIKRHAWIMQCWLTNFCCNSYWERLPEGWREALLSLSDEEMQELPAGLHPPTTWPPELRELVLTAQQLAPPTQAELDASVERVSPMLLDGIPHVRNMGPKKQHEVLRLAPVVAREAARCGASTVVDLGSGHGYLSHVLAFHHGLHVIGIECAAHNCAAAHHRAWMVREKLRDVKFRVSNPKAPTKAQLKMAELSAHVALGGGEKVRAEAAPPACECSLRRPTSPQVRAEAARAEEANAAASAALEAAHEAARRGEPSPLVAYGGGSFTNLVVRLEPDASVPWLVATLQPAVDLIGQWLARTAEERGSDEGGAGGGAQGGAGGGAEGAEGGEGAGGEGGGSSKGGRPIQSPAGASHRRFR